MNLAQVWEICLQFMYDESYVDGLATFLKSRKVKTIIDCAGGTGFPCIELKEMGWDISYADGDPAMFLFFKNKIAKTSLNIPTYLSEWNQLSDNIKNNYDLVLCRGNSLVYTDSWRNSGKILQSTRESILKSLAEFYQILKRGGIVYVDIINKDEFRHPHYPFIEQFGEKTIDGKRWNMTWEVNHDLVNNSRTVKVIIFNDGNRQEFILNSYLLSHKELASFMRDVGFKDIQEISIPGEKNYNVFIGHKPII